MQAVPGDLARIRIQRRGRGERILQVSREKLIGERVDLRQQVVDGLELMGIQIAADGDLNASSGQQGAGKPAAVTAGVAGRAASGVRRESGPLAEPDRDPITLRGDQLQRAALENRSRSSSR